MTNDRTEDGKRGLPCPRSGTNIQKGGAHVRKRHCKKMQDEVRDAVLKVALGFQVEEVTEEYDARDGELKLIKRRETRKDIPPDLKAVRLLLEGTDYSALSDEELEAERARLAAALSENKKEETSS